MGSLYMVLEGFWRGWTNISMLFVGGLCAFLIGELNEYEKFYSLKMYQQCLIGTFITLTIEFVSGIILNIWLKLNIWNYYDTWGNICGQICIPYALLWFMLMPLCIFLDDFIRYEIFKEDQPDTLLSNYKKLIKLQ